MAPSPEAIKGIESKFLPVFWSPVHFPKQAGTMGIMCDPGHPALTIFLNDGHTDWQWWSLVKNAKVVNLDSVKSVTPIIDVVDNFVRNRSLAYLFEAKSGNGKLLFSAFDILNPDNTDPAIIQMKNSLLNYLNSDKFNPCEEISAESLNSLQNKEEAGSHTTPVSIYE